MNSNRSTEHFVTLFDSKFLPMGMALHDSLMTHAQPVHLWILCMDELTEKHLKLISLSNVTLIPLKEIETKELLAVKPGRTPGEYCWTLTPFTPQAVFDRDQSVARITYLDADIFFFDDPGILLNELSKSGKHVLITEHAYAPEYDQSHASGRFCVQFMTFRKTQQAAKVMKWWQNKCLEWCFDRLEDGKFGDQKYLDCWPELFGDIVHIVQQVEKTLAPWNVLFFEKKAGAKMYPVFYHFQTLRIISPRKIRLYRGYKIGKVGLGLYDLYLKSLRKCLTILNTYHIEVPYIEQKKEKWEMLRYFKRRIAKVVRFASIDYL
ncbi:MAG: glycosyl transferase [Candidatus Brocadia sp.]|nr:hypothetical protein [Candidatus Brocadia sp.]MDG6027618.1 glycosyl transferase [Candidatus Brocadia sp.]